jgi:hypothetical protein
MSTNNPTDTTQQQSAAISIAQALATDLGMPVSRIFDALIRAIPPLPERSKPPPSDPSDDLLWGVAQIAAFLGIPIDRAYYLIRRQKIQVKKLGPKTIVASKKQLRRTFTVPV